jgi:hypothetical protein
MRRLWLPPAAGMLWTDMLHLNGLAVLPCVKTAMTRCISLTGLKVSQDLSLCACACRLFALIG